MCVVGVVVRLSSRPIVDRLLIAVVHTVVALLTLPIRPWHVCLCDMIVTVSGVGLATILKLDTFHRRNFTKYVGCRAVPASC